MYGPSLDIQFWEALFAPSATPRSVIERLNAALEDAVVTEPSILKTWQDEGVAPYPKDQRSPAAGQAILKSEIARWGAVIRDNNIHLNNE